MGRIYFGAEKLATWELASLGGAVLMFLLRRMSHIQQESLLVVHDLGVQVSSSLAFSPSRSAEPCGDARAVTAHLPSAVLFVQPLHQHPGESCEPLVLQQQSQGATSGR